MHWNIIQGAIPVFGGFSFHVFGSCYGHVSEESCNLQPGEQLVTGTGITPVLCRSP
jgi:hypothetical protein